MSPAPKSASESGSRSDVRRPLSTADVTALLVAYDSAAALPACLEALGRKGIATIVVDNASRDGTVEIATRFGAAVHGMALNEGYGRANNAGAALVTTRFILVCNPDAVVQDGAIAALLAAAERYPDAGLFAPRIIEPDGRFFFQPRSLLAPYLPNPAGALALPEGDCCAPFLSGACFLMPLDLFRALGGFDPAIFLFYEDDDLCRRIAESGRALVHVHDAVVRHERGRSSRSERGRVFRTRWHQAWSRAYVSAKWELPNPAPRMALTNAIKAALACLTLRPSLVERYAGSAAGAWAAMRGHSALTREGIRE